jgi:hypothetical protein
MRIRLVVIAILLSLFAGCTVWGKKPAHAFAEATGGEQLERVFWQELKSRNYTELDRHMGSTFLGVTPQGTLDRTAMLEHLRALEVQDYALSDFQVQWNGPDALVSYTATAHGTIQGHPFPASRLRILAVWHRANREWTRIASSWFPAQ